jgi:uncharacterized membrane protein
MDDVQTVAKGEGSRIVDARRFVIRDRQAFAAIWAAHAGPESDLPPIDFEHRMVAAVFAGDRPTPGYEIEISGTERDGEGLVVCVAERAPDPSLVVPQLIVSPFHIATLPRDDGKVRFTETNAQIPPTTIVFKPGRKPAPQPVPRRSSRQIDWGVDGSSSTGLTPRMAAALAYLAGPFSGALLLATERTSRFVRFHAWQAVFGLGVLGTAAVLFLIMAFVTLIASPTAFWAMLWLAAITGVAWVIVWALCLRQAYIGRLWKLPIAGAYAERFARSLGPTSPPAGAAQ